MRGGIVTLEERKRAIWEMLEAERPRAHPTPACLLHLAPGFEPGQVAELA
jgi:hypothetical protein